MVVGILVRTKQISAFELLKRINSSCSSGYERRNSVSGMNRRLMRPHLKEKLSSIAWQISVLSIVERVHGLPRERERY